MTTVKIDPGICKLATKVIAESSDGLEVTVTIVSACDAVKKMAQTLGNTFDAYEVCLQKPGTGPFYTYAAEHFPGHCACPTISGIIKAMEVECKLALPQNVTIQFE